jgi:hypothetical protein
VVLLGSFLKGVRGCTNFFWVLYLISDSKLNMNPKKIDNFSVWTFLKLFLELVITFLSLYKSIPMKSTKESYLYTKILFFAHKDTYLFIQVLSHSLLAIWSSPLLLHSFLPHSSNATYTYNDLGIISFHKDGVLTCSRCYGPPTPLAFVVGLLQEW